MPRPIRTKYTIPYGAQFGAPRAGGKRIHQGCDYHCPIGTPIYGTGDGGKVIFIGYNPDPNSGSGNNVVIQYPDGRITTDMHLRERTPLHVGSVVNVNTLVGHVGLTGNAVNADPPGSHDHHQMTLNGKLIDPESFYGTSAAGTGTPIEIEKLEHTMVTLWNTDDKTRRAYYDGVNFEEQSEYVSTIERVASGIVNVSQDQWDQLEANANRRRAALIADIAAAVPKSSGAVDYAALAKAVNDDAANRLRA